jgi:hypothetical protein
MKSKINVFPSLKAILFIIILSLIIPACSVSNSRKVNTQKRGLMLQDKSQFSKNKKNYKPPKAHKNQMKKMKRR